MSPTDNTAVAEPPTGRRTARDLMTVSPRTCSRFSTVTEAVLIFRDEDCGAVPVVEGDRPVGILTDRDVALAAAYAPDLPERPVSEVMTRDPVTVPADASWEDVEGAFREHDVRRLLVTGESGALLGIIAWADLVAKVPNSDVGRVVSGVIGTDGPTAPDIEEPPHQPNAARPARRTLVWRRKASTSRPSYPCSRRPAGSGSWTTCPASAPRSRSTACSRSPRCC